MQGILIIVGLMVVALVLTFVWSPYGLIFFGLLAIIAGVIFYGIASRDEGLPPESHDNDREASQGVGGEFRN